ncbi:Terpenoid cyclases/Protein prenyltransferases superfamily protein [Euphorbia peplus]|nr:Terpenoid cyclases/Protein prenyltransferases superfamily protein [Euphorbia peplus]
MAESAQKDVLRGASKNIPIGIWGYSFSSISPLDSELESYTKDVEELKEKVRDMLIQSTNELSYNIEFINLLCRLGVSYHFEDEIDKQLNHIFTIDLPKILENNNYQLSTLATLFLVLRQHGYKMTSDVFKKFKDEFGEFKKSIINDVKGLLSLYEACFLAVHGEDILDEALHFTRKYLETLADNSSPHLRKHIRNALILPYHHNMERLNALHYISFYNACESPNGTLLKFAKLDFNWLQLLYRKELALLSTWWENTNIVESLPYARDRVAEAFIWAVGSIFEPQYRLSRMILCKHVQLEAVLDDTYDTYGTMDELKCFTAALERLTIDDIDELPEYMKFFHTCISKIFEETENNVNKTCSYKASYANEMFKELARSYLVEKSWNNDVVEVPSFDEYMQNGRLTSTFDFVTSAVIQGMENMGIKEIIWVRNNPPIIDATKFFGRLMNDIAARKDETKREDFPKGIDCYMKQYKVSRNEAIDGIFKLLENKWKNMNEDLLKPPTISKILLKYAFNFARMSMVFYIGHDLFTYESSSKELITSLFIKPIPM